MKILGTNYKGLELEREGDNYFLQKNMDENENQGSELDELTRDAIDKDPSLKARIEEAEKLIAKLNQDKVQFIDQLVHRMYDQHRAIYRLKFLNKDEKGLGSCMTRKRENINLLQLFIDKLRYTNKAYQGKPLEPSLSGEELRKHKFPAGWLRYGVRSHADAYWLLKEINASQQEGVGSVKPIKSSLSGEEMYKHKLHFQMVHGTNSLAKERKLLKKINASERQDVGSFLPLKSQEDLSFSESNWWLHHHMPYEINRTDTVEDRVREIKELEGKFVLFLLQRHRDEVVAIADAKDKIPSSLGSKKSLREQVKILDKELDELRKEKLGFGPKTDEAKSELKAIVKDIESMRKKLSVIDQRKKEARQCILKIIKTAQSSGRLRS